MSWRQRMAAAAATQGANVTSANNANNHNLEAKGTIGTSGNGKDAHSWRHHQWAGRARWDASDWRVYYDERAGIIEFDGGFSRPEAKARAYACCVSEWLNQHPFASDARECAACGGSDASDVLVPYGTTATGHTWLHSRCWPAWHLARTTEAETALRQLGVPTPNAKASS